MSGPWPVVSTVVPGGAAVFEPPACARAGVEGAPRRLAGNGARVVGGMVSVVIPCHNQGQYLGEAIASALAQSGPPVEIVVVDDGSTDHTAAVAAGYPEVRCARQARQGLAAARNAGFQACRGDFVVFLDADDRLVPAALATGVEQLERHPECAFVYGRHRLIAADGSVLCEPRPQPRAREHYLALLQENYIAMHGAVMYRRAALEAVGGFDPSLRACEDYDLYLRIARAFPIVGHDVLVAEYRQHAASMSRDPELMLTSVLAVLRAQAPLLRGRASHRAAWRAGMREQRRHYGGALLDLARAAVAAREWRRATRLLAALARHYPRGYALLFRRLISAWLRPAGGCRGAPTIPPVGQMRFGDLRRLEPLDRDFGYGRGQPVDRYYIARFLARWSGDVRGRVLEIGDNSYTRQIGGGAVIASDVLDVRPGTPGATLTADLTDADHLPADTFDCIILTQTLHLIYDLRAAVATLHRILKPGGVLLATVPGISQISRDEWGDSWYWSFTARAARRLFAEVFPADQVVVRAHGNVLAAVAFLQGVSARELTRRELEHRDSQYELLIGIRAVKLAGES